MARSVEVAREFIEAVAGRGENVGELHFHALDDSPPEPTWVLYAVERGHSLGDGLEHEANVFAFPQEFPESVSDREIAALMYGMAVGEWERRREASEATARAS